MICNAVHPEATVWAEAGVTILPCSLVRHADEPHLFEVDAAPAPSVWEPWQPQVGDYVRVQAGPECQAYHACIPVGYGPVYGRVEMIDRHWDDTAVWVRDALKDGESVGDCLESARESIGHYYYVQDTLDGQRVALIDEHCCALELTKVPAEVAIAAIDLLRAQLDAMSPNQRLMTRLGLEASDAA